MFVWWRRLIDFFRLGRATPDRSQTAEPRQGGRLAATALDEARLRQQAIGVKLRQAPDEVIDAPIPDEFLEILKKAEAPTGAGKLRLVHSSAQADLDPNALSPQRFGLRPGRALRSDDLATTISAICEAATDVLGPVEIGRRWMVEASLPSLGGLTSEQLLSHGRGHALISYLNELRFGARG